MIRLNNICKTYPMGSSVVKALQNVSLLIEDGEFVAIMGPSGSGKSTLLHTIGLLDSPDSGSYQLNGKEVSKLTEDELATHRREEMGFIFQQFNLLPRMSAIENVSLPQLYSSGFLSLPRANELLQQVGLEPWGNHRPNELSGGQQQRVAIARALVNHPNSILADEPTGNLDSVSENEIMTLLECLNDQGITVIIVTHEEAIGRRAKRLIRMRDGCVQSDERRPDSDIRTRGIQLEHKKKNGWVGSHFVEHARQGMKTLLANKVRTGLSMLGILIGVAAVVAMLALGKGAQQAIEAQLSSLGSNLLVLRPGSVRMGGVAYESGSTTRLTLEDAQAIQENIPSVKDTGPTVLGRAQASFLANNWNTQAMGVAANYARMHASEPQSGRFFSEDENRMRSRVAVLGSTVAKELFGDHPAIGEGIKVNKINFQVIGVLPPKGAMAWRDQDDLILIPVLTAMHRLLGKDYVNYIDVEVLDSSAMESTQKAITTLMLDRHHVSLSQQQDAFQVRNMADIQSALTESSRTMSLLLASIAAISLLVGGIGIMNIMLVSVTERTKEVGLRKAVGARRRDILLQFLIESVVVSVIGGCLGILAGAGITSIFSKFAGWATSISYESVMLAFTFSAGIGILFGLYPAKKASKLLPIEALRFE